MPPLCADLGRDECGSIRIEKPWLAAQSMAGVDDAAIHTGGCGACSGLGSTSTPSYWKNRPW